MHALTHSYETFEDARNVVRRLEDEGVPASQISLIGRQQTGDEGTARGAALGGAAGGAAGLLAGLGLVAIPGIGPVVAVGWLASTLVGASAGVLAGGLIGALTDAGVPENDAGYYAETVRRGGAIVSVRVGDADTAMVREIMESGHPIDRPERQALYESEGWNAEARDHPERSDLGRAVS